MLKLKKIFNWLNDSERWHDLGHILSGFLIGTIASKIVSWWLALLVCGIFVIIKELVIDGWSGKDNIKDTKEWMIGILCAILLNIF